MIIRKYGISLIRLKRQHIELVRQKRNLSYIQEKMIYQKLISRWSQWLWFRRINNKNNVYFLIQHQDKFIGLINGKDIDFEKKTCEGGIFIWEKEYWNTYIPVAASVILNDYNFLLANFETTFAKVLKENKNALEYNLKQGYEILEEKPNGILLLGLNKETYKQKGNLIRKAISALTKDYEPLSMKDFSLKDDSKFTIRKLYTQLPSHIQNLLDQIK